MARIASISAVAALTMILAAATCVSSFAGAREPIGRIVQVDKSYWAVRIDGSGGGRDAAPEGQIFEGDAIQTVAHQHMTILLVDGTELVIGSSTRLVFKNWTGRDSDNHCIRELKLVNGIVKAKVRKIYSQSEPFVVSNPYGVVAVRGTEFVTEAGMGGRQWRYLSPDEVKTREGEVEVHTFEGEVHLGRSYDDLKEGSSNWVPISAGQTSLVRETMPRPEAPHSFDVKQFSRYLAQVIPNVPVNIVKSTTNTQRAELAENSADHNDTSAVSHPAFAQIQKNQGGRSIASSEGATQVASEHRAGLRGRKSDFAPVENPEVSGANLTTDGVRSAIYGGDVQNANQDHDSMMIARQNQNAVGQTLNGGQGLLITGAPPVSLPPPPPPPAGPAPQTGVTVPTSFPRSH